MLFWANLLVNTEKKAEASEQSDILINNASMWCRQAHTRLVVLSSVRQPPSAAETFAFPTPPSASSADASSRPTVHNQHNRHRLLYVTLPWCIHLPQLYSTLVGWFKHRCPIQPTLTLRYKCKTDGHQIDALPVSVRFGKCYNTSANVSVPAGMLYSYCKSSLCSLDLTKLNGMWTLISDQATQLEILTRILLLYTSNTAFYYYYSAKK